MKSFWSKRAENQINIKLGKYARATNYLHIFIKTSFTQSWILIIKKNAHIYTHFSALAIAFLSFPN